MKVKEISRDFCPVCIYRCKSDDNSHKQYILNFFLDFLGGISYQKQSRKTVILLTKEVVVRYQIKGTTIRFSTGEGVAKEIDAKY